MNPSKTPRFTIRINPDLHEWFKAYAQRMNASMSQLVIEYIEGLQNPQACPSDAQFEQQQTAYEQQIERADFEVQHFSKLLEEKDYEIRRLSKQIEQFNEQLARRDEQIESLAHSLDGAQRLTDQSQQLLAIQTKTSAGLAQQVQAIEDQRNRSWWKRLFGT